MEQGVSSATRVKFRLIAVLALAAAAGACSKGEQTATSAAPAVPVLVAKVEQRNVPNQLQEIGTVEAFSTVNVKARAEGQLVAIHFKEGDYVSKGQLLFNLDPRPLEAALHQAQATLARDQAQDLQAETDERRYAFLLKEGVGSQQQYDQAHATAGALRATVAADRAAVETARLNLQYAEIHSPIDGRTGNLQVHVGDLIKADADTPMVVINQVQPIYVQFSVAERELPAIRAAMAAGTVTVSALPAGEKGQPAQGKLAFYDNTVDSTTGTISLRGIFENQDERLWPGQFVNVNVALSVDAEAVVVPQAAVQIGQAEPFVFVVKGDNTAEARKVRVTRTVDGNSVIASGLEPGERVVIDGQLRLSNGSRVEIRSAERQTAPGSAS